MFGAEERIDSNLHEEDQREIRELLEDFAHVIDESLEAHDMQASRNPYGRPADTLVVIDPENIHLVVDDTAVGGRPLHVYRNETGRGALLELRVVLETASRDAGFKNPIGLSFPAPLMKVDSDARRKALAASIGPVLQELKSRP